MSVRYGAGDEYGRGRLYGDNDASVVAGASRRLESSWAELEVSAPPRLLRVSWAELELPVVASRLEAAWAELELPEIKRRLEAAWTELEVPGIGGLAALLGSDSLSAELVTPTYTAEIGGTDVSTCDSEAFTIKQGDTRPALRAHLKDGSGNTVSLAGATVRFHMATPAGAVQVDAAAVAFGTLQTDSATGEQYNVEYQWAAGNTATPGNYRGEFEITFGDGTVLTIPNADSFRIKVRAQLK